MKVTPAILQHEFIGLKTKVAESSNPNYVGIEGKIIDETRNTFVILHNNKRKTIVKDQTVFHVALPDETIVEINGKVLVGRPEERLKKRTRRLW
ncbi:MAG: ribonuclease P protein component 1 [Candidatus Bathyarchaeia archaeon]